MRPPQRTQLPTPGARGRRKPQQDREVRISFIGSLKDLRNLSRAGRPDIGGTEPGRASEGGRVGSEPAPAGRLVERPTQDRVDLADGGRRHRPAAGTTAGTQCRVEAVEGGGVQASQRQMAERGKDRTVEVAPEGDPRAPGKVGHLEPALQELAESRVRGGRRPSLAWLTSRARSAWASRLVRAVPVRLRRLPVSGSRPALTMTCQALPRWRM
jgi:hypothetical protein